MDDRETVKTWVVRNLDLLADYRTDAVENSLTNMVAAVRAPLEQRIKELEEWKVLWSEEDDRMEQRIATLTADNERLRAALIADREYWGAPHRDPASYDSAREDAWDMGTTALAGISDTPPHAAAPPSNVTASANAGSAGSAGATQEPEG